jgi:hypothetical protein
MKISKGFACTRLKYGNKPDKLFNPRQLRMGIKVEHEHTNSSRIAKMIAKAHLMEHKDYYTRLRKARL